MHSLGAAAERLSSVSGHPSFPDAPQLPGLLLPSGLFVIHTLNSFFRFPGFQEEQCISLRIGKVSLILGSSFPAVIMAFMQSFLGVKNLNQFMFRAGAFIVIFKICSLKAREVAQRIKLLSLQARRLDFKPPVPTLKTDSETNCL